MTGRIRYTFNWIPDPGVTPPPPPPNEVYVIDIAFASWFYWADSVYISVDVANDGLDHPKVYGPASAVSSGSRIRTP